MRKLVLETRPLVFRHSVTKGVDWGVERLVLARINGKELWWCRGQKVWDGNYSPRRYEPASIHLILEPDKSGYPRSIELQPARRSKKFFRENAEKINEFFDCDVAEQLRSDATLAKKGERFPLDLYDWVSWQAGSL